MIEITLNNGVKMPQLGLGVFRCDDEEAFNCVKTAIEAGYRHIDTAAFYDNEKAVGEAVKSSGIKREELFITTKLWNDDQRADRQRQALEDSLKRLDMDYVDLYLIHWPVKEKFVQTWLKMEKIYDEKLARAVGVSNFNIHHLDELKEKSELIPSVNQIELHPLLSQANLVDECLKRGIRPEAWSPLGANKNNLLSNPIIIEIAENHGKCPAQVILRWDIQRGIVAVPKSSNPQRQKQNINIFDFELSAQEMQMINALNTDTRVGSDPETFTF